MEPSSNKSRAAGQIVRALLLFGIGYTSAVGLVMLAASLFLRMRLERYPPIYDAMICHAAAAIVCAVALLRFPSGIQSPPGAAKLILLMVTLVFILSVDRTVNVLFPPPIVEGYVLRIHDQRGWATRPLTQGLLGTEARIDRYGFRVTETGPIRDIRGRRRILFIGDSLTFGYGLTERLAFCEQTVDILNQRRPNLDVVALNAGVPSYDTGQEGHFLAHEGFDFMPSLVVLQICLNDITTQFDPATSLAVENYGGGDQVRSAWDRSGLYRLARRLGKHLGGGDDRKALMAEGLEIEHFKFEELLTTPPTPRVSEAWGRTLEQLASIITVCRGKKTPLVVLLFPIQDQMADASLSVGPQIRLADFARQHGTIFLDMLSVYEARMARSPAAAARFFLDETHPTAIGHRIAGEALADLLESTGLLQALERP